MLVFLCEGVARPVLIVPWIVIQELDSLKVHQSYNMCCHFCTCFCQECLVEGITYSKISALPKKLGNTCCMCRSIFWQLQFGPCFSGTC